MKIGILVTANEALKIGIEPGRHTVSIAVADLTPEERATLSLVTSSETNERDPWPCDAYWRGSGGRNYSNHPAPPLPAAFTADGIRAVLAEYPAYCAGLTEKARVDAQTSADLICRVFLNNPSRDYVDNSDVDKASPDLAEQVRSERARRLSAKETEAKEKLATYLAGGPRGDWYGDASNAPEIIRADVRAEDERRRVAKVAAAEAARQAEADAFAAWVAQYGDASQQERHAAGVLPRAEVETQIKAALTDLLFSFGFAKYEPLTTADLDVVEDCCCDHNDFVATTEKQATWPAEAWETRKKILAVVPDATVKLLSHTGHCRDCDATTDFRLAIHASLTGALGVVGKVRLAA